MNVENLMSKLKNYREYTMLDEYQSIITLLKKELQFIMLV